jgi:hypothetical protein
VEAARIAVVNPATLAVVIKNSSALPAKGRDYRKAIFPPKLFLNFLKSRISFVLKLLLFI